MSQHDSLATAHNLIDQAAAKAGQGIGVTQRALGDLANGVEHLRAQASPRLDEVAEKAQSVLHSGMDAVRRGSQHLRDRAHDFGNGTTGYVRDEPVKAILIAAAAGAALMALMGLLSRRETGR